MAKIKTCPGCGRTGVDRWAILPKGEGVVCQSCFRKTTGHAALPSSGPLTMLTYHHGQSLYDGPGNDTFMVPANVEPDRKTIRTVTIRGCTVRGATIRGCTIRGVTLNKVTVRHVTINRAGNPILGR
ncbi:MAG TPA: hypothetical protein VNE39_28690 [Planctomycetota bacterium]|nr:hypothetical protein [Planctomycetota bacterium]